MKEQPTIKVAKLVRTLVESLYGNMGLLHFTLDYLGRIDEDKNIWEMQFSFYKSIGAQNLTNYIAKVNLNDKVIEIKRIKNQCENRLFKFEELTA